MIVYENMGKNRLGFVLDGDAKNQAHIKSLKWTSDDVETIGIDTKLVNAKVFGPWDSPIFYSDIRLSSNTHLSHI